LKREDQAAAVAFLLEPSCSYGGQGSSGGDTGGCGPSTINGGGGGGRHRLSYTGNHGNGDGNTGCSGPGDGNGCGNNSN
jgi:hypothetical protein